MQSWWGSRENSNGRVYEQKKVPQMRMQLIYHRFENYLKKKGSIAVVRFWSWKKFEHEVGNSRKLISKLNKSSDVAVRERVNRAVCVDQLKCNWFLKKFFTSHWSRGKKKGKQKSSTSN